MTLREIDLSHLTDEERNKVLEVLQRDEHLRESEQKRVRNLKDEVKNLRLKGTIREGRSATRTCARCRESFGIIFNTGSVCAKCQHRVCKKCQESVSPGKWICVFCFRQMEFEAKSGNWFYSKFPRSMRDRATNEIISGGKLVHDAISSGKSLKTVSAFQMKPSSSSTPKQNQHPGQSTSSSTTTGSTPLSQQQRPGTTVTTSPPQQPNPATSFQPSWTKVASRNQSALPPKGGEAQESQVVPQSTGALSSVPQITIIPDKEEATFPTGDSLSMKSVDEVDFEQGPREDASPPYKTNLSRLSAMSASTESVMSYYSCAGEVNYGKIAVTGEIQFGINYNPKTSNLEVTIRRCKDIAVADPKKNRSDPYVKCYLLPDKSRTGKRKTHCKKNTLNPVFDEILKFSVKRGEVESRTLSIMVWNYDRFGRNDFLGEVDLPLTSDILQDTALKWYKLGARVAPPMASMLAYKGDLDVSLKYDNARRIGGKIVSTLDRGELQVLVKQARNLTPLRSSDASDPFCQAYLLPNRSKHDKQKTAVVKHSCNPIWNHTFIFEGLSDDELRESSLELAIWDHDRLTSHEFLGGVRLNLGAGRSSGNNVDWMDAKGDEMSLWQAMLDRPNTWIDGTLLLRVHMTPRK